ncbi:MAG: hypothetical protein ABJB11_17080 [Ferruginibacter sp.]
MVTTQHLSIISRHKTADVWYNPLTQHRSIHAAINFKEDDIIEDFYGGKMLDHTTYLTIQTDINSHIALKPAFLQFVSHSCNQNVFFNEETSQLKPV